MRRSEDRDREHREINDAVENVRGVIDQLKCFLNARADLAGDGNSERKRADENDRVDRCFVTSDADVKTSPAAIRPSLRPSVIASCR